MGRLIAVTGGIGSGKSAVCRCLELWGFPVYDCDSRAKRLMDDDREILGRLRSEISPDVVTNGVIDRKLLAQIVFADPRKLEILNSIVHTRVKEDIRHWKEANEDSPLLFVETAILLESSLHLEVDEVWLVEADEETRLQRACNRDSASKEAIRSRMAAQRGASGEELLPPLRELDIPLRIIDNNGREPLLSQLLGLLNILSVPPTAIPGQWKN